MSDLLYLIIPALAAAWWWQARQAKQLALYYALQRCRALNLQLLDQSVVLRRTRLQRDTSGQLCLRRYYQFEFSSTGDQRYGGRLTLAGQRLLSIELDPHVLDETSRQA